MRSLRKLARRILAGPQPFRYVVGLNEVVHQRNGKLMQFHTETVARECFMREVAMSDFDGYLALYRITNRGPEVLIAYRTDTRSGVVLVHN